MSERYKVYINFKKKKLYIYYFFILNIYCIIKWYFNFAFYIRVITTDDCFFFFLFYNDIKM